MAQYLYVIGHNRIGGGVRGPVKVGITEQKLAGERYLRAWEATAP